MQGCFGMNPDAIIYPFPSLPFPSLSRITSWSWSAPLSPSLSFLHGRCREWAREEVEEGDLGATRGDLQARALTTAKESGLKMHARRAHSIRSDE